MNIKKQYGTSCERCGSLVYQTEVSLTLNGRTYHGACVAQDNEAGSAFQCGICNVMKPTINLTREVAAHGRKPAGKFTVWACEACINLHNLSRVQVTSLQDLMKMRSN